MEPIILSALTPIVTAPEAALYDLGDGIACFEFRSKSNSISTGVANLLRETFSEHMKNFDGLVVGNQAKNFSVGADLTRLRDLSKNGDIEGIRQISARGEALYKILKAYPKPVVSAPYRNTLGGGLELVIQSHRRVAHADVRMGLVEAGVGLLPGGGGLKETALYALTLPVEQREQALLIGFDKLICKKKSRNAEEAFSMGYLREGDVVVDDLSLLLSTAKEICMEMPPRPAYVEQTVELPGAPMYHKLMSHADQLIDEGVLGPYDHVIAGYIAAVLTGGDSPARVATEQELLQAEQDGFAQLGSHPRTYERILHLLEHGELLKN